MTIAELGKTLSEMYHNAPEGEAVAMIHLFAIKHAREIQETGASAVDLAKAADISETYGTEINKGVKLAKYVSVK